MDLDFALTQLVEYALAVKLIEPDDRLWAYNAIGAAIGVPGAQPRFDEPNAPRFDLDAFDLQQTLQTLIAGSREFAADGSFRSDEEIIAAAMGVVTPRPSIVTRRFYELFESGPQLACDYLYRLSCDVDYVKRAAIAHDIKWTTGSSWGELEVTINLSKPEKDPRAIAQAARSFARTRYPACQLCIENEGYQGRGSSSPLGAHPARQNLRIVPLGLAGEQWGLQYSPYAYYDEHCIVMSKTHRPMHVDRSCFSRLLEFAARFPTYFIGSNADLPIVGGSILSHDHFQGGRHVFAMMRAPIAASFTVPRFPNVSFGVVKWPVTVLRLRGTRADDLVDAATHVLDVWRTYSDESAGVLACTDETPHNTVTPIARMSENGFVLDLALRSNITSDARPFGVFHPREELHHIKKENIGLIEVMGMAILPPRLKDELEAVASWLTGASESENDPAIAPHAAWARDVALRHPELDVDTVRGILRAEVGRVFAQVLEDVGVFKWDDRGRAALERFIAVL